MVKGNDGFGGYMINLVGNQSSKCLDKSMDRGNVNFATVYIYTCSGSNNQLWDYRPVGDGWYQFRSAVDPSRCLTAASIFQDADVWVEDCHVGEGNQQWHIANF